MTFGNSRGAAAITVFHNLEEVSSFFIRQEGRSPVVDDDEVRVVKEGMSVEETRVGAHSDLSAGHVRRTVGRHEVALAPREVDDVYSVLVPGLEDCLVDKLPGRT